MTETAMKEVPLFWGFHCKRIPVYPDYTAKELIERCLLMRYREGSEDLSLFSLLIHPVDDPKCIQIKYHSKIGDANLKRCRFIVIHNESPYSYPKEENQFPKLFGTHWKYLQDLETSNALTSVKKIVFIDAENCLVTKEFYKNLTFYFKLRSHRGEIKIYYRRDEDYNKVHTILGDKVEYRVCMPDPKIKDVQKEKDVVDKHIKDDIKLLRSQKKKDNTLIIIVSGDSDFYQDINHLENCHEFQTVCVHRKDSRGYYKKAATVNFLDDCFIKNMASGLITDEETNEMITSNDELQEVEDCKTLYAYAGDRKQKLCVSQSEKTTLEQLRKQLTYLVVLHESPIELRRGVMPLNEALADTCISFCDNEEELELQCNGKLLLYTRQPDAISWLDKKKFKEPVHGKIVIDAKCLQFAKRKNWLSINEQLQRLDQNVTVWTTEIWGADPEYANNKNKIYGNFEILNKRISDASLDNKDNIMILVTGQRNPGTKTEPTIYLLSQNSPEEIRDFKELLKHSPDLISWEICRKIKITVNADKLSTKKQIQSDILTVGGKIKQGTKTNEVIATFENSEMFECNLAYWKWFSMKYMHELVEIRAGEQANSTNYQYAKLNCRKIKITWAADNNSIAKKIKKLISNNRDEIEKCEDLSKGIIVAFKSSETYECFLSILQSNLIDDFPFEFKKEELKQDKKNIHLDIQTKDQITSDEATTDNTIKQGSMVNNYLESLEEISVQLPNIDVDTDGRNDDFNLNTKLMEDDEKSSAAEINASDLDDYFSEVSIKKPPPSDEQN